MLTRFDALVDAIVRYSGYTEPTSSLYRARNPGGLKAFSPKHQKDVEGNRVFLTAIDGEQALHFDLNLKLTGQSQAHLEPTHTLVHLALSYNLEPTTAGAWLKFLRLALGDNSISAKTPLSYFLKES